MEYKGYNLTVQNNRLAVEGVVDFELKHVFECGQCFRWMPQEDGSYRGIVSGRAVKVSFHKGTLFIDKADEQDFMSIWYNYFDLGTDYSAIKATLSKDPIMEKAIKTGYGMRLLKQDLWETIISFILSSNNIIPRIRKIVEALSRTVGDCIDEENNFYCFPKTAALANASLEDVLQCRAGYRGKYIYEAAQQMALGKITEEALAKMDTGSARKELMKLPGVGPKVADCILLFSGLKYDVFPTDVWVKRVMEELYLKRDASLKEIQHYATEKFGSLTGYAQQYLFYHARLNKIGMER